MEESRALSKLSEATDLLVLLEDILNPASVERLSSASWSGLRLTLRNARVTLQESQSALSKEFVSRARGAQGLSPSPTNKSVSDSNSSDSFTPSVISSVPSQLMNHDLGNGNGSEQSKVQITRRDLKATLEKFIETR